MSECVLSAESGGWHRTGAMEMGTTVTVSHLACARVLPPLGVHLPAGGLLVCHGLAPAGLGGIAEHPGWVRFPLSPPLALLPTQPSGAFLHSSFVLRVRAGVLSTAFPSPKMGLAQGKYSINTC